MLQGSTHGPGVALPVRRLHSSLSVQFLSREVLAQRGRSSKRHQQHHGDLAGSAWAQLLPRQSPGAPVPGTWLSWFAGTIGLLLVPRLFSVLPRPLAPRDAADQGPSCSVLTLQPMPRTAPLAHSCCAVATAAVRVITSWKRVSLRVCLLTPARRVLVHVYGQQIPSTARSLSQSPPVPAGLAFCHVPFPSPLPTPVSCSPGQFKRDHVCRLSFFASPGDPQLHHWESGSSIPVQCGPVRSTCAGRAEPAGSSLHLRKTSVPEGTGLSVGRLLGALLCLSLRAVFLLVTPCM